MTVTSNLAELIAELKSLILEAAEQPAPAGGLMDEELLFGPGSRLSLDSLDALQISMAIQHRYGIRMPDSKETRRALSTVTVLAKHLQARAA